MTVDLDKVTPVNHQKPDTTPVNQQQTPPADTTQTQQTPQNDGPPPSNKERADAAAAKKAAEEAEAAKAKEAADAKAKEGEEAELDTSVWGDANGDEVGKSVLHTLQNSGVSVEEAKALLWDAVEAGDPSKVDRDALVEKVGKEKATLIMAGIENVTSRNNARIAEVVNIATEAAGGEANWTTARDWAKKNIPENELNEYRAMLDAGGKQAKFAAQEIVARYNADANNTALNAGKTALTPDTAQGTTNIKPITRREYGDLLVKAERRGATQAEFNELRLRRQAGIKQGI